MSSPAPPEQRTRTPRGHDALRVVAFTAPSCGHCHAMLPELEAAAARPGAPALEIVDVTKAPSTGARLGVSSTPTVIGYRGTREVGRMVGRKGPLEIRAFFDGVSADGPIRRSWMEVSIRLSAAALLGGFGLYLEATPLVGMAGVVSVAAAIGELRARRG